MAEHESILILDFGSQYTQLIARRIRELHVYCEIHPCTIDIDTIVDLDPKAIVLSGGPASLGDPDAPAAPEGLWELEVPMLGICYGMQLMARDLGGRVKPSDGREYGHAEVEIDTASILFGGIGKDDSLPRLDKAPSTLAEARHEGRTRLTDVWMSHGDRVDKAPEGFHVIAATPNCPVAAMEKDERIFGLQFHPEVSHTTQGMRILENFIQKACDCSANWNYKSFIEETVERLKAELGGSKVVLGLSGGVDSSVCAALLSLAIGENLICILVDNGLLRKNEASKVAEVFSERFKMNLVVVDAAERFYNDLKGVEDPEEKRKIIGRDFIEVFEEEAAKKGDVAFLAQGTIYPDVIESISFKGPSATIKSHHNVGGLPERMNLKLIEPLRELFKDEVRRVGLKLGLPGVLISRHPFPGPGLAVRVIGEVTRERCDTLREADRIYMDEIRAAGWYDKIAQAFAVLLPIKSVGVMGDERTHEDVLVIRAVSTTDFMTADWSRLPYDLLARISNRIINEVRGINRVTYDISSKPPATIEWE